MNDISDFFKSGFLSLHKNAMAKNYQQKTLKDRVSNFNNMRRETRNTIIFQKRQIDENMTPISTPEPSKIIKTKAEQREERKPNKRLDMLQKWKMEKEKRKQDEKRKAKPLFKVCHVPVEVGLPDLENVNKKIKGKPIKSNTSHSQSQSKFAPPNHKFHAPKNIKPVQAQSDIDSVLIKSKVDVDKKIKSKAKEPFLYNTNIDNKNKSTGAKLKAKTEELKKKPVNGSSVPKAATRTTSATSKNKKEDKTLKKGDSEVKSMSSNVRKTPKKSKNDNTKLEEVESKEGPVLIEKKVIKKDQTLPKTKNVGWNRVELAGDQTCSTPTAITKRYRKTPKRQGRIQESLDVELTDEYNNKSEEIKSCDSPIRPKVVKKSSKQSSRSSEVEDSDSPIPRRDVRKSCRRLRKSNSKPEPTELDNQKESNIKSRNSTVGSATGSASPDFPIDQNSADINTSFHTPVKNNQDESPVYISPFVTVSRGKTSARKEFQVRRSAGGHSPEFGVDVLNSTSPKAGAEYFSKKLNNEISRIESICDIWNDYKNSNDLSEEATDMINVAIGQSKLLISKKFQQFRNLIEQCRKSEYDDKRITCEDLHGFWDMVYMQVIDLEKRFNNLNVLKANDWQEIIPERKAIVKRGRGRPKKAQASAALKDLIKAVRNVKKPNNGETNSVLPQTNETKVFEGGYYSVKSPVRQMNEPNIKVGSARKSLRISLLANQTIKNRMSSPGLTVMKISQAIKCGDGVTPSKSILKTDLTRPAKRITKSVLFKDDLHDIETNLICSVQGLDSRKDEIEKENNINDINLITFSPVTPTRRSKRLIKLN